MGRALDVFEDVLGDGGGEVPVGVGEGAALEVDDLGLLEGLRRCDRARVVVDAVDLDPGRCGGPELARAAADIQRAAARGQREQAPVALSQGRVHPTSVVGKFPAHRPTPQSVGIM